ncbi:YciI family protein [Nocardioides sp. cx-173]|uniref:YciI family protein n=1 Tax=Nocardioides sp. cx-173 TaxID=2898796 RepID=UPI001E38C1CB|nr:YciI family protein [Nocardioides sp. cx-173]MCD4526471.1 YciI family protein [Nocardioides sp. cx-173]UGB41159.1 YciI family protein [Nocardioides sp. cx-173]
MRFLVLMAEEDHFARWDAADEAERHAVFECFQAFDAAVKERGTIVAGEALASPAEARTLGPGPTRAVTDGPYAETVEQTGGFYLVDLPSHEAALEAAALLPPAYTVEVRPVLDVVFD